MGGGPKRANYVALLRGINVGGHRRLPMNDLIAIFSDVGAIDPRTYIQSGNVVFTASPALASRIADDVEAAIRARFGYDVPVLIRSGVAIAEVAGANPFIADSSPPDLKLLHVAFLAGVPDPTRVAALDPNRSPGDEFAVRGAHIYVHYGAGAASSKLTHTYFETALGTRATARNWRTTLKLAEMAAS